MMLEGKEKLIFYELVRNYIFEGRPQGSKILAKKLPFKISPPTLRLYFRRLFQRGLIIKPGKFSGRIPTDEGWKYYIFHYQTSPEIKIKERSLEKIIKKFVDLSSNIVVYHEKNKTKILGLNNITKLISTESRETIDDILRFIEKFDKIEKKIGSHQKIIKIGSEIENSKSKNLCLAALRKNNRLICFLGPKRNYYHTLWSILNKFLD